MKASSAPLVTGVCPTTPLTRRASRRIVQDKSCEKDCAMLRASTIAAIACLSLGLSIQSLPKAEARPMVPAERRTEAYRADIPACDNHGVLDRIVRRFQEKESDYWGSQLQIAQVDRIGETGFRANGPDYIPRRYCLARVLLSDGNMHQLTYWIGEGLGIIGLDYGLEFCVAGVDRNWAYAPNCRAARP
jgi:hypothetical protein